MTIFLLESFAMRRENSGFWVFVFIFEHIHLLSREWGVRSDQKIYSRVNFSSSNYSIGIYSPHHVTHQRYDDREERRDVLLTLHTWRWWWQKLNIKKGHNINNNNKTCLKFNVFFVFIQRWFSRDFNHQKF